MGVGRKNCHEVGIENCLLSKSLEKLHGFFYYQVIRMLLSLPPTWTLCICSHDLNKHLSESHLHLLPAALGSM